MKEIRDKDVDFRFMAIFNRWGTALASNLPGAIFHLYEKPSVALIYDPTSKLNLERFIKEFKVRIFASPPVSVKEVVSRFDDFLKSDYEKPKIGKGKKQEIIFIGFNSHDIYPMEIRCEVYEDSVGKFGLVIETEKKINVHNTAFFSTLGDFNYVISVIDGVSPDFESAIKKRIENGITKFKDKLLKKALRLDAELTADGIKESFLHDECLRILRNSQEICYDDSILGLETFSMEEMGDAIENLINAEICFSNPNKVRNSTGSVYERAVMTIPEGFTWIKQKKTYCP